MRVGEREHKVEIVDDGHAVVDGVTLRVVVGADGRIAVQDDDTRSLVSIAPGVDPKQAGLDGLVHEIAVVTAQQAALAALGGRSRHDAGGRTLKSPMPGRIVRVLVGQGDVVEANAAVVIVEAMKMENEVRSGARAKVVRIAVAAGDTVDAGQLLCELEPHGDTSGETAPA